MALWLNHTYVIQPQINHPETAAIVAAAARSCGNTVAGVRPGRMKEGVMIGRPAVVLLSGGLDSTTVLAIARSEGYEPYALSFRYGQRHSIELDAARRVAEAQGVARHVVADVDLRVFGGSALTDDIDVP